MKKKTSLSFFIFTMVIIGVCLLCFFLKVHPLYIYDTDDWTYISYSRPAWPTVKQWNPTKILPEVLMPLCAELGVRFIYPFTGDYIGSMAIVFGITLIVFIMGYLVCYGKVLDSIGVNTFEKIALTITFVLYHFIPYNINEINNRYLFYGGSVNCTYNYLLPGLLNAAVVMYFMSIAKERKKTMMEGDNKHLGILLLIIYLCLNSNMFHSIILASYAGSNLLFSVISWLKNRIRTKKNDSFKVFYYEVVKSNMLWILIDLAWFVILTFEVRGNRAARSSTSIFELPVGETINCFINSIHAINKMFLVSCIVFILSGFLVYFYNVLRQSLKKVDEQYIEITTRTISSTIITIIYLILLCSKVSPEYLSNNIVEISWIVWLLFLAFFSLAYVIRNFPRIKMSFPLLLFVLLNYTVLDGKSFAETNVAGFSAETVKILDENLISQIKEADEKGFNDVTVIVPKHASEEWPMALSYGGDRIAISLFRHGITSKQMNVILVMDSQINDKYHLP